MAGTTPPPLPIGGVVGRRTTQGYWRIHDRTALPSLKDTNLLFIDGEYLEIAPPDRPILTLIPTAMFGPPEKVWSDKVETSRARASCSPTTGKGASPTCRGMSAASTTATAREAHAGLMTDVIDHLLPNGRQLRTNAHPLVEMTLMDQPSRGRTLVHLVNGTGHQDTAYSRRVEMRDIRIELPATSVACAQSSLGRDLPVTTSGRYRSFTLPCLKAYEVIIVE